MWLVLCIDEKRHVESSAHSRNFQQVNMKQQNASPIIGAVSLQISFPAPITYLPPECLLTVSCLAGSEVTSGTSAE